MAKRRFKYFKQFDSFDCGPACLRMISNYYGKKYSLQYLRQISHITKEGVSLYTISGAAEKIGFKTLRVKLTTDYLVENVPLPCILHWNNDHFVVLYKVKGSSFFNKNLTFYIADPSVGKVVIDYKTFTRYWTLETDFSKGFALALEPTEEFYKQNTTEKVDNRESGFKFLYKYFKRYKRNFFQLFLGMLMGSMLSFILPFLTQSMVDIGIGNDNLSFIFLILIFQLFIFLGNTTIDFIRSFLILHIGTNVNISIISDFLTKLMKLPIGFFDSKLVGDILQRIEDHKRIEQFLTTSILDTLFSVINIIVLSIVLGVFGFKFLLVFLIISCITFGWSLIFMKRIKTADYKMFNFFSRNRDNLYEIVTGMPEIKLNGFELYQRWKWETNQLRLFNVTSYVLKLRQYQKIGGVFFTQLKNIIITYIAALQVINGEITFGIMLSITYIIGQLNSPIDQIINFLNSAQSAKISLERMREIHAHSNEETDDRVLAPNKLSLRNGHSMTDMTKIFDETATENVIELKDVSFQYEDEKSPYVLQDLNLKIRIGKITAIVGPSGSGKTTLLKLLLKFYRPTRGGILFRNENLNNLPATEWREKCGVVMQEGHIFADTIMRNIVMSDEDPDIQKVIYCCKTANIYDFVESLPLKFETKMGGVGVSISTGQKQRILIARAIYKNPDFLFFDEATSSLDAANEREIVENLNRTLEGKTVIIIAHRLSTVKNAHQIVVLNKGRIVESGGHQELISSQGNYFNLIRNQLELGT